MSTADGTVDSRTHDVVVAVRNALRLGGGLIATWGVALVVRFLLPRYLGPARFGAFSFSDAFATASFVLVTLGVDTYIRRELPVRPRHADDFFGGMLAFRLLMAGLVTLSMAGVMALTHRPAEVQDLVFILAGAQGCVVLSESFAACLHARGRVGGLVRINVASKLLWAAGTAVAVVSTRSLIALGAAEALAEAVKALLLFRLCRRETGLRVRLDWRCGFTVVLACLPFYLQYVARNIYSRLDVTLLTFASSDVEVGWYSAASNLADISLLITPMFSWVLLPLYARAAARSDRELTSTIQRSLEIILTLAIPVALGLSLGSDLWIRLVFGERFAPAAISLRILAPMAVLTYVATVCSIWHVVLHREWRCTAIAVASTVINASLVLLLIGPCSRALGAGGGGAGCALAQLGTESFVTVAFLASLGGRAWDTRTASTLLKSLGAGAAAVAVDRLLTGWGAARVAVDLLVYAALVLASRAVRPRDTAAFARLVIET